MLWSDDPVRDHDRYWAEKDAKSTTLICDECENSIYERYYYDVNGEILCPDCFFEKYALSDETRGCEYCGRVEYPDDYYFIIDGEILCPDCADKCYRKENE